MTRLIFILLLLALFGTAGYANQEQMISLHFFNWIETNPVKLYVIASITFFVGFIVATLLFCPSWMRSVLSKRVLTKRIEQLEIDLDRIRSNALKAEKKPIPSPRDDV